MGANQEAEGKGRHSNSQGLERRGLGFRFREKQLGWGCLCGGGMASAEGGF